MNEIKIYTLDGQEIKEKDCDLTLGTISAGGTIEIEGKMTSCKYYIPYSNEKLIEIYKGKLRDTDYVIAKIAEGVATKEEYADVLANRAEWRKKINELEAVK